MTETRQHATDTPTGVLDACAVRAFHDRLDTPVTTSDPLEELRALEELRNAISARQAHLAVAATDTQTARDIPRGINRRVTARKVGADIGLARRCTPHAGSTFLQVAHALTADMPHTLTALASGVISEWDATRIVRETTGLSRADRAAVDAGIADHLGQVAAGRVVHAAREHAWQVDPDTIRTRRVKAEADRRVTMRPAPDAMAYLTAFLPVKDALACMAALNDASDTAKTTDASDRPRGQVMADALTERVTGRKSADPTNVHVNLLMPLDSLTGDTPAHMPGYGPVPADLVRDWFTHGDPTGPLVRRMFTYPGTGDIIGMETRARHYPGLLAMLILLRDQVCRTPWCGAPIRHTDHIQSHAHGGATSERDGQGMCERCNYDKEHPDHHTTGNATETTTRSGGFTATSRPPVPPGLPPPTRSPLERWLMDATWLQATEPPDQDDEDHSDDDENADDQGN